MLGAVIRHSTNPTMLKAGYKVNVVPGEATAHVDGRFLDFEDEFFTTLGELVGDDISIDYVSKRHALETTFDGDLVDAITSSILAEEPDAPKVAPYLMSGGTDAKHWKKLGIGPSASRRCALPADLDFTALFHGVDERVPVDAQLRVRCAGHSFRFLDRALTRSTGRGRPQNIRYGARVCRMILRRRITLRVPSGRRGGAGRAPSRRARRGR